MAALEETPRAAAEMLDPHQIVARPPGADLRRALVLVTAAAALVAAAAASLTLGAVHVPLRDVVDALTGQAEDGPLKQIVLQLRLPRTIDAILVGAALGTAGAVLQGALGNPLASPDVIGVTGGAGFGAVLILLVFPGAIALLPIGALVCGSLAAALVFAISWWGPDAGSIGKLLLAGIAVGSFFFAATTSIMVIYSDRVQSAVFWIAGGLSSEGWQSTRAVWPYFIVGFIAAIALMRPLDRLALGDDVAASLGARPRLVRLTACATAAVLAAAAASLAGLLGFLGLVTPHLVRLAGGDSSHTFVIPASALSGAAILLAGDTLARVVAAPVELPVGPFMVALGVPLFLWLLRKTTV
ncbi:MAG TPA: iron ABC transporter permease [Solirubrobacteraceae bacterium]|nr:iron ABC transporter permease [Solirubrobacteraceae bacterium]